MARKPKEVENDYAGVEKTTETTFVVPKVSLLNQEFTQVSELNVLRDKINEIIKQL